MRYRRNRERKECLRNETEAVNIEMTAKLERSVRGGEAFPRRAEGNNRAVIPLKFTTTDGQEVSLADYAAVPIERLQKLEEIAITAMKLIAAHNVALGGNISTTAEQAISDLTRDVRALEEIWDLDSSIIEDRVQIDSDQARIAAGH